MKFRSERTSSCLTTSNVQLSNLTPTAWLTCSSQTEWDRWPTYYAICLVGAGSLRNAAPVTQAIWYLSWKYENDLVRGKWVTAAAAGYSVKKLIHIGLFSPSLHYKHLCPLIAVGGQNGRIFTYFFRYDFGGVGSNQTWRWLCALFLLCVCIALCVWCWPVVGGRILLVVAIVHTIGEVNFEWEQTKGLEKKTDLVW